MTIPDKDHFVLPKTISGIKEQVRKTNIYGNDDLKEMRNNFDGMLEQLLDVVNELHKVEVVE
jgi:hypothetical protein